MSTLKKIDLSWFLSTQEPYVNNETGKYELRILCHASSITDQIVCIVPGLNADECKEIAEEIISKHNTTVN